MDQNVFVSKIIGFDKNIGPITHLPKSCPLIYYEIQANFSEFSVGFSHKEYNENSQIGWNKGSVGYHGDDGGIYIECDSRAKNFYEPYHSNDIIGFGIYKYSKIFFTLNGKFLCDACTVKTRDALYPMIGIFGSGKFTLNCGQKPFIYSFEDLISKTSNEPLGILRSRKFNDKYKDYVVDLDHDFEDEPEKKKKKKKK